MKEILDRIILKITLVGLMDYKVKILYVEDDNTVNILISKFLESKFMMEVISASNGKEGIEYYKKYNPDIIITDLSMPETNGIEMISRIREIDSEIPIVVTTAFNNVDDILTCVNFDIEGFIVKPVNLGKLVTLIEKIAKKVCLHKKINEQNDLIKKFQTIFEKSPIAKAVTSEDFVVEYKNDKFEEMFCKDCESDDCMIINCKEIINENIINGLKNLHSTLNLEVEKTNDNSFSEYFNVYINPLILDENKETSYVFLIEDMSKLKSMQKELIQFHRIEAVGHLAAGIAHEFNNILTAIIGYTSVIKIKVKDEMIQGYVEKIIDSAEKASQMTKNLLAFSRKDIIQPEKQSLNFLVKGIAKMFSKLAGSNITINVEDFDENLQAVYDLGSLEQVMYNILKNSVESIKDKGIITISISVEKLYESFPVIQDKFSDKDFVVITIKDNGCGMNDEVLSKAFDPFFTTKKIGEGPGLGLSISYGIIKQNNGYLSLESEEGKGTVAKIFLPTI